MRTALRWKRFASCAIWAGTVAENISVRRSSGEAARIEFEIVAKAEIEHLIGFVQHDGADRGKVERAARDVVAQASRGADDDVRFPRDRLRRSSLIGIPPTQVARRAPVSR